MTPLYAELNRWRALPFRWGESDCIMVCMDWIARICGVDPAADLRLTYASFSECRMRRLCSIDFRLAHWVSGWI